MITAQEIKLARALVEKLAPTDEPYNLHEIGEALQVDMVALLADVLDNTGFEGVRHDAFVRPQGVDDDVHVTAVLCSEQMMGYLQGIIAARLEGK